MYTVYPQMDPKLILGNQALFECIYVYMYMLCTMTSIFTYDLQGSLCFQWKDSKLMTPKEINGAHTSVYNEIWFNKGFL